MSQKNFSRSNAKGHLVKNCPSTPARAPSLAHAPAGAASGGGTADSSNDIFDAFMERCTVANASSKGTFVGFEPEAYVIKSVQDCDVALWAVPVSSEGLQIRVAADT